MIKTCYGKSFDGHDVLCRGCELREYCKAAADKVSYHTLPLLDVGVQEPEENERQKKFRRRKFSYADIVRVLKYLAHLPAPVLRALSCCISDSGEIDHTKLSALAAELQISRQAVWKALQQAYVNNPELKKVFTYRRRRK